MKQNIIHIGLDVDDTQYNGAAFNKETGEVTHGPTAPTQPTAPTEPTEPTAPTFS